MLFCMALEKQDACLTCSGASQELVEAQPVIKEGKTCCVLLLGNKGAIHISDTSWVFLEFEITAMKRDVF